MLVTSHHWLLTNLILIKLWRRKWQPTPASLPGKPHRQRSLAGYSPWGCKTWTNKPPPPPLRLTWAISFIFSWYQSRGHKDIGFTTCHLGAGVKESLQLMFEWWFPLFAKKLVWMSAVTCLPHYLADSCLPWDSFLLGKKGTIPGKVAIWEIHKLNTVFHSWYHHAKFKCYFQSSLKRSKNFLWRLDTQGSSKSSRFCNYVWWRALTKLVVIIILHRSNDYVVHLKLINVDDTQ